MRTSCIQHPPGERLYIGRESYLKLCGWDHCAAVLLSWFEFSTNGEIDKAERSGSVEPAWISAPMPCIYENMLRLYSIRSLQDRISWLVANGLLEESPAKLGEVKQYRLDIDIINGLISSGSVIQYPSIIRSSHPQPPDLPSAAPSAAPSAKLPTIYKEEVESSVSNNLPPTPYEEKYNTSDEELSVEPCDEDGSVPVQAVRSKSRWPSRRKEPKQKGLAARISEAVSGSDDAAPSRFEFRRRTTATPPPPCPDLDTIQPIIDSWNAAVPSCPADLSPIHDRTVIARAHASMSDPEFSGSVEEIMRKCAEIRKSRPDQSSWCTFRWLFSQKGDQPVNWFKVKCGALDWKPVDSRPQSQQQKNRSLTEKLLAEALARKADREKGDAL